MQNSWLVLLPPVMVVFLAATTRRVILSLLSGIFTALLLLNDFSITKAVPQLFVRVWQRTELGTITSWQSFWSTWYLFICLFLLILGILIVVINASGGAYAYADFVSKRLKDRKHAEGSSLLLSLFFFVDDYFSCLTVGSVMQAITDRFKIPRVKLAVLVNSMAVPLVVIVPVSSWVAQITMQLRQSGVAPVTGAGVLVLGDPFFIYAHVIPFIFYSFILVASVVFLVSCRKSFGLVCAHEKIALESGNLFGGKMPVTRRTRNLDHESMKKSSVLDFVLPIGVLFISVFVGILYFGNYVGMGGSNSLLQALQHTQIAPALFVGAVVALATSLVLYLARGKFYLSELPGLFVDGIKLMGPTVFVLILIWTLSNLMTNDLATGQYLAHVLIGHIKVSFLPVMFFITAALTASTMGSAWGSIGILVPIAIPMMTNLLAAAGPVDVAALPILYPLIGAIISGAVVGNHISPISDTMLMSSSSAGAYHLDVVRAQFELTFPTIVSTALAFLVAGLMVQNHSWLVGAAVSLGVGLVSNVLLLTLLSRKR